MISIVKASAGSGKTHELAHTYMRLLGDLQSYRHILAVTFTNKATAEMKDRILRDLRKSGRKDLLGAILHDYSAFSVSTIDKFFQRALKAFAKEIGLFADYQIELDRKALIAEAMDSLLDSLEPGGESAVFGWLRERVQDKLNHGQKPDIEEALYEMGTLLKSEEQRQMEEKYGANFSQDRLLSVRKSCDAVIKDFTDRMNAAVKEVHLQDGRAIKSFKAYKDGFTTRDRIVRPLAATLCKEASGTAFMDLFEGPEFLWYNTAWTIREQWFSLGLASEFYKAYDRLLKDKNIVSLDESNSRLRDIIDGSDTPFVYEKLGVRYDHYLLDEFQDTSRIQWENFRPLLLDSAARGGDGLIVGDVKQSIYRWRDSDWHLLGGEVEEEFGRWAEVTHKQENWRSLSAIREFNNGFFSKASSLLGGDARMYSDVVQHAPSPDNREHKDGQKGHVTVTFCDEEEQCDRIIEAIKGARGRGARYSDICILVRGHKQGFETAAALIGSGIPVISDDSLNVKSSSIVRKLVSILSRRDNPSDMVGGYISREEGIDCDGTGAHSLTDLCEEILRSLREKHPHEFEGETLYIQAFMDKLRDWVDANGSELHYFLKEYGDKDLFIGSPENSDSVRILTIHKAKGLQAPFVIFPFADKVTLFKDCWRWCRLDVKGTPFAEEVSGIYPVHLTRKASPDTLFAGDFEIEEAMQMVDSFNIFYVALTRAEKELHIIAAEPSRKFRSSLGKAGVEYSRMSEILYEQCRLGASEAESGLQVEYGTPYDYKAMYREPSRSGEDFPSDYVSYPLSGRLKISSEAGDFFASVDETQEGYRHNGTVYHDILSRVVDPGDLEAAVDDAVSEGLLSSAEGERARCFLSRRIAAHPEWFEGEVINEASILTAGGHELRPDRAVVHPDGSITIIDYKFGNPKEEYSGQVRSYMELYRNMGYPEVDGFLWYVYKDRVEKVHF